MYKQCDDIAQLTQRGAEDETSLQADENGEK